MDSLTGVASGDVRFTPESGRFEPTPWMSAYDPKRTFQRIGHTFKSRGHNHLIFLTFVKRLPELARPI